MGNKQYFYVEVDHLANRGSNKAVEVYQLTSSFPKLVAANYDMTSASWAGYLTEVRVLIRDNCGHKTNDVYSSDWIGEIVTIRQLGESPRLDPIVPTYF